MPNPNHDAQGKFASGPGEGASRTTMTQAHAFRTRGNIRVKSGFKSAFAKSSGGGGSGGGGGGGDGGGVRLTRAARERKQLNRDLDRRGQSGGGAQAQAQAGNDIQRAFKLTLKLRR